LYSFDYNNRVLEILYQILVDISNECLMSYEKVY